MDKWYNWIIICVFVFIFGYCVISKYKYDTLKDKYEDVVSDKNLIIDSLYIENKTHSNRIMLLENTICDLSKNIDSLEKIKNIISKETFEISEDVSIVSTQLKNNLLCVDL